ncbi:hypothetical protein INR49_028866 [Caranx melampygus]|nr:hypothetical protein INR49_028866 [Caranx melampygus]
MLLFQLCKNFLLMWASDRGPKEKAVFSWRTTQSWKIMTAHETASASSPCWRKSCYRTYTGGGLASCAFFLLLLLLISVMTLERTCDGNLKHEGQPLHLDDCVLCFMDMTGYGAESIRVSHQTMLQQNPKGIIDPQRGAQCNFFWLSQLNPMGQDTVRHLPETFPTRNALLSSPSNICKLGEILSWFGGSHKTAWLHKTSGQTLGTEVHARNSK